MGPGILPGTTVGKYNPLCHLQMPTKALSCEKEAICEHGPEAPLCPVGKAHLKWTVSKWKRVLWSDESKFDILVGNHGRRVLWATEEGDLPAFSSKASISDGMWVHKCKRYGQLACFGRRYGCWKVYKGFRATYAPLQTTSIYAGQCKTTFCSYYNSMIHSRRVRLLIGLPAVQIFHI